MDNLIGKIVRNRDFPASVGVVEGFIDGEALAEKMYSSLQQEHGFDKPSVLQKLREYHNNRKFFILRKENVVNYVDMKDLPKYDTLEKFPLTWRDIGRPHE